MEPFINILLEDTYEPEDKDKNKKGHADEEPIPEELTSPESTTTDAPTETIPTDPETAEPKQ